MEIKKGTTAKIIKIRDKKSKCPTCKNISNIKYLPFCSKKCSDEDLIKWLSDDNFIKKD